MALHRHRAVGREQDRARCVASPEVQAGRDQLRLDRICGRQSVPCVQAGAHAGDDVPFGFARPVGDEGQGRPSCRHLDQVPVAPQPGNGGVKGIQRVPPGPVGQRPGTQVVGRPVRCVSPPDARQPAAPPPAPSDAPAARARPQTRLDSGSTDPIDCAHCLGFVA